MVYNYWNLQNHEFVQEISYQYDLAGFIQKTITDLDTLPPVNMPANLRNFLSFYTIFQFRVGIIKVARSCISKDD